ncbi:hypothetical protein NLO85_26275 [Pseudomonas savastanoi]|uniref:Uncharacterized protein n=1 Tax=Pseudomonas savastanoi TaxID=29438 RepID=A0AAW5JBW3_PSESS|nr:hypothetical protein [Pseudomonas savastanoi]KPX99404.1 Unknown protein sequence [Pseudomonas savastanoi pv. nerii]KWS53444.1 hypothetical protein AL058_00005 [Pseudomonas savastanoi pv. nerii]MCQ3023958.1 hypothetical protein [Pseudomonas savastanoi]PAB33589.1 hypothetical protein CC202_08685 [Pseudomonas savastanoi]RMU47699.1 hypothetical protein ALP28_02883 [Pseudomonas savastanoi pv. nerii]
MTAKAKKTSKTENPHIEAAERFRQLDKDISLTPSRRETSAIDRFSGGSSILSNAALRSGE